jgi:hypothetical protein
MPGLLVVGQLVAAAACAGTDLRIESRPISVPIEAYVRVMAGDEAVVGLAQGDFTVTLDGSPVSRLRVRLPPAQDTARKLSVVLVLADGRAIGVSAETSRSPWTANG